MILGLFGALYQKKIKRLVAFSSVSNIGYLIIGFIQENPQSISHSVTYFLLYMINVTGLFLIFLNLYLPKSYFFLERLTLLSGFINRNKWLFFSLIVLFFTAAGIPPFSLFFAKILILTGLSYQLYSILLFILVFSAILSGFYYLRVIKYMSFDIKTHWYYISTISYINSILLVKIIIICSFFWLYSTKLILLVDSILLSII
jgi:NADH-quinone oxidoreductase subunit N